jgi:PEGA domain
MTKSRAMSRFYPSLAVVLCAQFAGLGPLHAQTARKSGASASAPAVKPPTPLASALVGSAREDYEQAKILYADKDFAGAALKFQSALDTSEDARLLWNIAAAEKNQRHYARVEQLLQAYLDKSGPLATESERDDAVALLSTVHEFVAEISLKVNQEDASVFVDGAEVAKTPLTAALRVDMGERLIEVKKPGFEPFNLRAKFMGGTTSELTASLVAVRHEGTLEVVAEPGASIFVDGKMVGKGKWQGRLPSGSHQVEVTAPDRDPWHLDTVVEDNQHRSLSVTLPHKAKPTGVPTWLWVGGGILVAGLATTGAYFAFKPKDQGPPDPVAGSFATVELR